MEMEKTLSIEEYLNKIRTFLKDAINDLKKSDMWKIQLTIEINFISSKGADEKRVMHLMSDKIEIMINDKANEVIEEFDCFFFGIKLDWKHQWKVVILSLI